MNSFVFLEWFENQLMPALKNLSLVVLDNASYHNVKTEVHPGTRYHTLLP
jgi:transposase